MKKLLFVLCAASIFSCKQDPVDYALVSGKVENTKAKKLIIAGGDFNQEIDINKEDGTFADTLRLSEPGFYNITIGRESSPMYLKNGNNISITVDTKEFDETISYTGEGSAENNYLAARFLNSEKLEGQPQELYVLDEAAYKSKVEEVKASNQKLLDEVVDADENFKKYVSEDLKYKALGALNSYESAHAYFAKKKDFKVSEGFIPEELKSMTYDNAESYKMSPAYKNLAMGDALDAAFEAIGDDLNGVTVEHLKSVDAIKIPALKNDVLSYLSSFIVSPGNPNMDALYNYFTNASTDAKFKEDMAKTYDKVKNLVKGKPSPVFVNYENHKGGTTSLADLKGKYVYVDVWATWCGPCKREIPFLKEVEAKYHGKNIEFVSTSIDRLADHDAWVAMVKDKELGGIQLMADNDWKSQFVQDYNIQGIPRFILIDPDGNIVSADAPRPSNPKLIELFEELSI